MARLLNYWKDTAQIEQPYRDSVRAVMIAGPLVLTIIAIPSGGWSLFGRSMSWAELWLSGAFTAVAIFVGLCTFAAWGIAARVASARWAAVAAPVLAALVFPASFIAHPWLVYVWALIMSGAMYLALFRSPSYRQYLGAGVKDA